MQPESQEKQLLDYFHPYEHFAKCMLDAYALVDKEGRVVKCNQFLSALLGKKTKQILKSSGIDEHIKFVLEGKRLTAKDLMEYHSPSRIDEVRGETDIQKDMNLILGIYPFLEGDVVQGFFLLIRDVTAETNLQDKYKVKATQSITDQLTGLYNRTYFDQYLPEMLEVVKKSKRRHDQKISVIMADIDHFKMINDTYGHQAGDHILERVSTIFKENFRKTDVICRYGGEEFLTILPATEADEARVAANKLREAVDKEDFVFKETHIPVTISMGIAQIQLDAALYHAKDNGRNQVSVNRDDGTID